MYLYYSNIFISYLSDRNRKRERLLVNTRTYRGVPKNGLLKCLNTRERKHRLEDINHFVTQPQTHYIKKIHESADDVEKELEIDETDTRD